MNNAFNNHFKEKERIATTKAWKEKKYDHLKENGYFLKWGRENCKNMLQKSKEEKKIIAEKKIKTWLSHSEEEKKRNKLQKNKTLFRKLLCKR